MANFLYGSICLSDVPKELFKKACNGKIYLNIKVVERKEPGKFGTTHFISCEPKKEERVEGVNYIIGDLTEYKPKTETPSPEDIASAPAATEDQLPF